MAPKTTLFLDANVLFTAAYSPQGASRALFTLAAADRCRLQSSPLAADEARRNLQVKAPPTAAEQLETLLSGFELTPTPGSRWLTLCAESGLPEKDLPILTAAVSASADLLVTGDRRHFGPLFGHTLHGVLVLPPREALNRLLP